MLCLSPLLIVKLVTDVYLLSGRVVQTKNTAVSEIRLEMDLMYFYIVCTCFVRDCSLLKLLLSGSPISMPHCSCMFSHCQKLSASNLRSCTRYYHSGGCDNTDLLTQVRTISWTWQLFGSILLPVTSTCCPRLKLFRWRHIVLPRFFVYLGHLSLFYPPRFARFDKHPSCLHTFKVMIFSSISQTICTTPFQSSFYRTTDAVWVQSFY